MYCKICFSVLQGVLKFLFLRMVKVVFCSVFLDGFVKSVCIRYNLMVWFRVCVAVYICSVW